MGDACIDPNCFGSVYAYAAICAVALYLLIHNNPYWHGNVYYRKSFSGVNDGTN